jgi:3-phosphoshikimate 1-carboxyvinyltransferase
VEAVSIDTYEDHRMALAFAPYVMKKEGLVINNPQVVSKSYPKFWSDLKEAGFKIED